MAPQTGVLAIDQEHDEKTVNSSCVCSCWYLFCSRLLCVSLPVSGVNAVQSSRVFSYCVNYPPCVPYCPDQTRFTQERAHRTTGKKSSISNNTHRGHLQFSQDSRTVTGLPYVEPSLWHYNMLGYMKNMKLNVLWLRAKAKFFFLKYN